MIRSRLDNSARIQEGEEPAEDPNELFAEADRVYERLLKLIRAVNRTNSRSEFDNDRSIFDAIVESDVLAKRREFLLGVSECGNRWTDFHTPTVPVEELRAQADKLAKRYRELDLQIQELNWKTDLI